MMQGSTDIMPSSGTRALRDTRLRYVILAAFVTASLPLLYVAMPPIMDYPNHLARIWLLAGGADGPPLSTMYVVDWSRAATNVGVDWVAAQAVRIVGLAPVDRIVRLLMILGPAAASVWLGRVIFGRLSIWHVAPLMLAWTTTSIAGFMSYSISLAFALAAAALIAGRGIRPTPATLGVHVLLSAVLLTIHPFGLLLYLALVCGIVIGPSLRDAVAPAALRQRTLRIAVYAALGAAPIVALFLLASHPPSTSHVILGSLADHFAPRALLLTILSPILTYDVHIDMALILPLCAFVIMFAGKGWLRCHAGLMLVAAMLALLSLVSPVTFGDAAWLNRRLPLMAALTACSAMTAVGGDRPAQRLLSALLLASVFAKIAWIGHVWVERDQDVADLLAVSRDIAPGQTVAVVREPNGDVRTLPIGRYMIGGDSGPRPVRRHLPALLVPYRQAYIPTIFAIAGQQPIRVAPRMTRDAVSTSSIPLVAELTTGSASDPYLDRARCDFDYVLAIGTDEQPERPTIAGFTPTRSSRFAVLYRNLTPPAVRRGCPR